MHSYGKAAVPTFAVWIVSLGLLAGVGAFVWHIPEELSFVPASEKEVILFSQHWLKPDKRMSLKWGYDSEFQRTGWGTWQRAHGKPPKFHLVYDPGGDGQIWTRPEWWQN